MDLVEAVRSRRMVRSFSGAPLGEAVLDTLLDLAWRSPSAGNTGGREFVVLEGAETARYWDATTTAEWRSASRRWPGLSRAPIVIVVLVSPDRYVDRYSESDKATSGLGSDAGISAWDVPYWFFDAGAAVMALLLGATATGLGACFLGNFRGEQALLQSLGVPPPWRFAGAVLVGERGGEDPKSSSVIKGRDPLSTIIHLGSW
jgi:nitroreductase